MKKIYLLGLASVVALGVNAQTVLKVKNPLKKKNLSIEKNVGGPASTLQVTAGIVCNTQYVAGSTMDLNFTYTTTNTDLEYADYLSITFPAGITPNTSATNSDPFPNTEDPGGGLEILNGVVGQMISWGDSTATDQYGGIFAANGIAFTVNVTVLAGLTGNQTANFHLNGDGFNLPAETMFDGTFIIYEAGAPVVDIKTTFIQPGHLTAFQTCAHGLDTLVGQIKNLGNTTESNITVACTVNGVAQTPFVVPGPLAPGDSAYVFYLPGYDFNASSDYAIVAYSAQASDVDLTNDTAKLTFTNSMPVNLNTTVYANGCEAGYEYNSLNRAFVSGDGYVFGPSTVTFQSGAQALFYTVPNTATAGAHEAMVILPCLDVTAGDIYRITFYKRTNTANGGNGQSGVFSGLASDPAAMTDIVKPYSTITPGTWIKDSVDYTATATETRYFALGGTGNVVAGTAQINVRYDNINIFKVDAVGAKVNTSSEVVSVFPNPSAGVFTVKATENNSSVSVYSIIGENVYSSSLVKGNNTVDMSNLAAGTYVVKVNNGGTIVTKRVVINK